MKSLVGFASPILFVAFAGCSTSGDTADEFTAESAADIALADNAPAVADEYEYGCASDYLTPGIQLPTGLRIHQLAMAWDPDRPEVGGSFQIDPNACGLDEFGDRGFCTQMVFPASDMKLEPVAQKPGYRSFGIAVRPLGSTDPYTPLPLHLVTIAAHGNARPQLRLLVVNADQTIDRIIELH
jgi:hypothetical protein